MRFALAVFLSLCVCVIAEARARGQCGPRGCFLPQATQQVQAQVAPEWFRHTGDEGHDYLYSGNALVGRYSYGDGFYRRKTQGGWAAPSVAPIPPAFARNDKTQVGHTFGLEPGKVQEFTTFTHGGAPISRSEAESLIGATLKDDSSGGHLTNIDPDKERRKKVGEQVAAAKRADPIAANVRFQNYDPSLAPNKIILGPFNLEKDKAYKDAGRVLIAQAAAKGTEGKSRPTNWYGDIGGDQVIEAIRTIDPTYDPNKSPVPSVPSLAGVGWEWLALAGAGLVVGVSMVKSHQS